MLAGKIGSRSEKIGSVRVDRRGARGRQRATPGHAGVPELERCRGCWKCFRSFRARLLIVSAGDPMWRGGLSGPSSMFLHSRPAADQREPHQHAAARAGAHRARHSRRRGKRLDRRRAGGALLARDAAPLRRHQRAALRSRRWSTQSQWAQRSPTLFALAFERRDHGARRACAAARSTRRFAARPTARRASTTWRAGSRASAAR